MTSNGVSEIGGPADPGKPGTAYANRDIRDIESAVLALSGTDAPLNDILEDIVRRVDALIPETRSSILLIDGAGCLQLGGTGRLPAAYINGIAGIAIGEGVGTCGTAAARRQTVITEDVRTDALWRPYWTAITAFDIRACWSTPVLDASGQVLATFAMHYDTPKLPEDRDIAFIERIAQYVRVAIERSRERAQLRQSEARYRSIFNLVPVAIWEEDVSDVIRMIDAVQADGVDDFAAWLEDNPGFVERAMEAIRIVAVNDQALTLYNAETREQLHTYFVKLFDTDEGLASFKQDLLALAAGAGQRETEYQTRKLTGEPLHLLVRMHRNEEEPGRVIITEMDITARKRAEERFRVIAQTTSDVIWERDLATDTLWTAEGRLNDFGYPVDTKAGNRSFWIDRLHPDERAAVVASADAAIASDAGEWVQEYRMARSDGTYALVRERAILIRDDQGRVTRMIGNLVDLTREKELEQQLQQSQRLDAVGQLTGGIAHDFNNLLTVILGNGETLAAMAKDGSPEQQLLGQTVQAAERAAELTNRLMAFARKQSLDPKPVDVNGVIHGMEDLLRRTLTSAVEVDVDLSASLWSALVDEAQLESSILNLAINARDAMSNRGGRLEIGTRNVTIGEIADESDAPPAGRYVLLTVSDTGSGMTSEVMARVFEPFFTTKPVGRGSGLGLSMVYGFVKQSNGHIRLSSKPGHGTTISIYLPQTDAPAEATPAEKVLPVDGSTKKGRILLVEDDDMVRDHVENQIKTLGFDVETAISGINALERLRADGAFDLVLTDIVMAGGLNGYQLAEAVAAIHPSLPFLFTSGYTQDTMPSHTQSDSGPNFLKKPYRRDELALKIRQLIGAG